MGSTNTIAIDLAPVAQTLQLSLRQVECVVELLDAGNTVPFITRYRKDQTGGLDEEQIRQIQSRLIKLRLLAERKQTILRSIESQGKLTPELAAEIEAPTAPSGSKICICRSSPRSKRWPPWPASAGWSRWPTKFWQRAGRCADLDARAADFVNPDRGVTSAADALLGVGHILAELSANGPICASSCARFSTHRQAGQRRAEGRRKTGARLSRLFRIQRARSNACRRIACWRSIAAKRPRCCASKSKPTWRPCKQAVDELLVPPDHPHAEFLRGCGRDALARLVFPSLEREVRRELTDWAEAARRRRVCPQPAQSAVAAAGARAPRAGDRSGLQERLQAGGARRIRQPARPGRDPSGRQGRAHATKASRSWSS